MNDVSFWSLSRVGLICLFHEERKRVGLGDGLNPFRLKLVMSRQRVGYSGSRE